jgi:hypothetical protein
MIVDPDFLDHWRVGMLAELLGNDPVAPLYILRLWAHCQVRKGDTFAVPPSGLRAICRADAHDAQAFEDAMVESRWLSRDGPNITALDWAEKNRALIAAWRNGAGGGRPAKPAEPKPPKPAANPRRTRGEPAANPRVSDPPAPSAAADADFERWWAAYPRRRKTGKPKVADCWRRLRAAGKLAPIDDMMATLERQCASRDWQRDGGEYVPMPLTYLNQARYVDESAPAAPGAGITGSRQASAEQSNADTVSAWARTGTALKTVNSRGTPK